MGVRGKPPGEPRGLWGAVPPVVSPAALNVSVFRPSALRSLAGWMVADLALGPLGWG